MEDTKDALVPMTDDALALLSDVEPQALRPRDIDPTAVPKGLEGIDEKHIKLPRLAIAQTTSEETIEGKAAFMPDLKNFDMFNSVTKTIYGRGPLMFIPVKTGVKWIEYDPEQRGVPLDMDVPPNDPRTKWTKDAQGKGVPPKATEYVEFTGILLRKGQAPERIVISVKTTNKFQRKAADDFTTFIAMRNADIFRGMYKISTYAATNEEGTFGCFKIENAGFIPTGTPGGDALLKLSEAFYEAVKDRVIDVSREGLNFPPVREPGEEG